MARVCQVTGRGPMTGNNVSHSNRKTRRRFGINLQYKRFWDDVQEKFVVLRVSTRAIRTITKKGLQAVLAELRAKGEIV